MKLGDVGFVYEAGCNRSATCIECECCGILIMKPNLRIRQEKHHFCSVICHGDWQKLMNPLVFAPWKTCSKCGVLKLMEDFAVNKEHGGGRGSMCKECQRLYCSNHYDKNKSYYVEKARIRTEHFVELFNKFKSKLRCLKCGESYISCLDFHHRDSDEKEVGISYASRYGWREKRLKEEIDKCDILCANCHFGLHESLRSNPELSSSYMTRRHVELKKKCVEYLGGECSRCGYKEYLSALVFHHRDPKIKKFRISSGVKLWKNIKPELDKCELLCVNCHRKLHNEERLKRNNPNLVRGDARNIVNDL
jgi:hypothetical protein